MNVTKTHRKTPVRSHQLRTASHDQRETPCPWKPPERRREDRLEGYCEWGDVMAPAPKSLLRGQRKRGEKGERRRRRTRRRTRMWMLPKEARTTLHRRVLAPDSSSACRASVRDAVRNVLSCGSGTETRRKWRNATAQMWTRAAGVSDCIRNAENGGGGGGGGGRSDKTGVRTG